MADLTSEDADCRKAPATTGLSNILPIIKQDLNDQSLEANVFLFFIKRPSLGNSYIRLEGKI